MRCLLWLCPMRRSPLAIQIHRLEPKRSSWPHAFAMCLYVTHPTTFTLIASTYFLCIFQPRGQTEGSKRLSFLALALSPFLSTLSTDPQIKTSPFLPSASLFFPRCPTLSNVLFISSLNVSLPPRESLTGHPYDHHYRRYPNSPDSSIQLRVTRTCPVPNCITLIRKFDLGIIWSHHD